MPDAARAVLTDLLSRGQVARERVRDVLVSANKIEGYPFRSARALEDFHENLKLAEQTGAIALEWVRYHEGTQLARVRLKDPQQLAQFLGTRFLPHQVETAFAHLDTSGLPDWCEQALTRIRQRWLEGKACFGLSVDDADKLAALMTSVRALETLPADQTFDYRQFGARFLCDSKLTRTLAAPLAALYRTREDLRDREPVEVLHLLNLVPLAQPVLLRGPLALSDGKKSLDADVRPYLGVPTSFLLHVTSQRNPGYLLTIENQSSFNEYTATVDDDGIILYTAGFPTRAFQEFYRRLTTQFDIPTYHWGDTDLGGFRILKQIQQLCPARVVKPHQMALPGGENVSQGQMRDLQRLLPLNASADAAIARVLSHACGFQEQEATPARAVIV